MLRTAALALALAALLVPARAHAESSVDVQLTPQGMALAQQLGISEADLEMQIKGRVDDAYQTGHVDDFLTSFTDATSFSSRGIGVDYASAPTGFIAGVGVNVAAAGNGDIRSGEVPTAGLAANFAVMVGMNLREWNQPRWTIYGNGFYRTASTDRLEGSILSAGAHLQYRVYQPTESGGSGSALRWIGVSLTSGIEYTRWSLGAGSDTLTNDFTVSGSSGSEQLTLDSTGRFDLVSNAVTVPIEATTGIRIALIASIYVGVGVDLTIGRSSVTSSLNGVMHTTDNRDIGTVAIAEDGSHAGSPAGARILAGGQLNLWKVKLFVQINGSAAPAASIGAGIRFVQ